MFFDFDTFMSLFANDFHSPDYHLGYKSWDNILNVLLCLTKPIKGKRILK